MKVSVALCSHNGEQYITQQIESILYQSFPIDELIICDDASTDKTLEIISNYQKNNPHLIKIFTTKYPAGTIRNFEKAISLCTGEYIFLSDQDDIWLFKKVERTIEFMVANPECEVVFTNAHLVDRNDILLNSSLWGKWAFDDKNRERWKNNFLAFKDLLKNQNKITGATLCMKKEIVKNIIPIKVPIGYWHDAWIGMHAAARNSLCFIREPLINYRIHENQQVGIKRFVHSDVVLRSNPNFVSKEDLEKLFLKKYPLKMLKLKIGEIGYNIKRSLFTYFRKIFLN